MKKIQIDEIKVKENVRTDYGDLTELSASVREHGIRTPIEINSDNELIDGFRRVKAAKAAGLKEIPYFINEEQVNKTESQIISGLFQKNLNPIEEGKAFQIYMDKENMTSEQLAVRISKRKGYVDKRLELAKLPIKVQEALIKNKIQMGHALLLAKMQGDERLNFMKEIIEDDMSVGDAKDDLSRISKNLNKAPFCKKDCKNCIHNGSKQTELFETGTILSGDCMNSKCFNRKMKDFIIDKKAEFKDMFFERKDRYNTNEDPSGYEDASNTWNLKTLGITEAYMVKCRKNRDYKVRIDSDGHIQEYFKIPTKKPTDGEEVKEVQVDKKEQGLLAKVSEFKTEFLMEKTKVIMEPSKFNTKQLAVIRMMQSAGYSALDSSAGKFKDILDIYGSINVEKLLKASDELLDIAIYELSKHALHKLTAKELVLVSRNFGVDVKKDFKITEDYLKLYTKDQLKALGRELKLEGPETELKKDELISHILKQDLKGLVPKILL